MLQTNTFHGDANSPSGHPLVLRAAIALARGKPRRVSNGLRLHGCSNRSGMKCADPHGNPNRREIAAA
jgi:hypothetical protein